MQSHGHHNKVKLSQSNSTLPKAARVQIETLEQIADSYAFTLSVQEIDGKSTAAIPDRAVQSETPAKETKKDSCNKPGASADTASISRQAAQDNQTASQQEIRIPITDLAGTTVAIATLAGSNDSKELNDALQARDNQLAALQGLMADLLANKRLDTLLQNVADIMIDHTAATQALILLVDETGEFLEVVAGAGPETEKNIGKTRQRGVGFAGVAWSTGETQHTSNSHEHRLTRYDWPERTELLAIPLVVAEEIIGVSVLGAPSGSNDLSKSITSINNLCQLTSYTIATADAMEKVHKDLQNSRGISQISHLMTSIDDTEQLMDSVSKTLAEKLDFTRCTFYQAGEDHELFSSKTWEKTADGIKAVDSINPVTIAESSCYWSYENKETVWIPRKKSDPRESEAFQAIRTSMGMGCVITIPVIVSGDVFAVLMVSKDIQQSACDENEINLLSSIVQQLSAAIYGIKATNALRHRVYHDSLTDLPNRRQFEESLHRTLKQRQVNDNAGALLYLNLDGFKVINDTMGNGSGDIVLQLVAKRLKRCVMNKGSISRIGGDEFSVVLPSVETPLDAFRIAQSIRESILNPFVIGKSVANLGVSIGLCFIPTYGDTVDVLIRNADVAMQQAKISGKNKVVCFEEYMAQEAKEKLLIESELHDALEQKQLLLHFQPQVDPVQQKVTGVEALVRWDHPERGLVYPDKFIPIAEESSIINEIGAFVLEQSIVQLAAWKNTSLSHLKVSVNIAASQFLFGDISARISGRLQHHGVSPRSLEVELTESVVMKDIELVAIQLKSLQNLGVTVALDDFGTGYSSLSYLQDLPLDVLKIDRAFVARLSDENSHYSLVNTIMLLASGLGLETVAEGVETSEQLDKIVELGCNLIQGYYYSKPCSPEELENTLKMIEDQFYDKKAA